MQTYEEHLERAKRTHVADLPSGATIIVAHPGQQPNLDPKFLRENFGITPDQVITLDQSREAPQPPSEDDGAMMGKLLSVANGVSDAEHQAALDRIAELEESSVPATEHEAALARIAELEGAKKAPPAKQ